MANFLDLIKNPHDPDRPSAWGSIPERLLVELAPQGTHVLSPQQRAALNRIAAGEWFLVRNFHRAHCNSCRPHRTSTIRGAVHDYVTIKCVESPFNGLRQIMWWIESEAERSQIEQGAFYATIRDFMVMHPEQDAFVPISAQDAARLNARIRQRGGRPVVDQNPYRADEMDAERIKRRIAVNAHRAREAVSHIE